MTSVISPPLIASFFTSLPLNVAPVMVQFAPLKSAHPASSHCYSPRRFFVLTPHRHQQHPLGPFGVAPEQARAFAIVSESGQMQIVASNNIGRVTISFTILVIPTHSPFPRAEMGEGSEETDKHGLRDDFFKPISWLLVEFIWNYQEGQWWLTACWLEIKIERWTHRLLTAVLLGCMVIKITQTSWEMRIFTLCSIQYDLIIWFIHHVSIQRVWPALSPLTFWCLLDVKTTYILSFRWLNLCCEI